MKINLVYCEQDLNIKEVLKSDLILSKHTAAQIELFVGGGCTLDGPSLLTRTDMCPPSIRQSQPTHRHCAVALLGSGGNEEAGKKHGGLEQRCRKSFGQIQFDF